MEKKDFINAVKEGAIRGQKEYGISASLTIAQGILESGWGRSGLSQRANNLFGVKAFGDWSGEKVLMDTLEYEGNRSQEQKCWFKVYKDWNESIEDHAALLATPFYERVRSAADYREACFAVQRCGYATDPTYGSSLIEIIEQNNLQDFDEEESLEEGDSLRREEGDFMDDEWKEICGAFGEIGPSIGDIMDIVLEFQKLCNYLGILDYEGKPLEEDGILGSKTESCISKIGELEVGDSGIKVAYLQESIRVIPVDGDFGEKTKEGVMDFQKIKGLIIDGIVGKNTWSELLKG